MLRSIALLAAVLTLSACGGGKSSSLPQGTKPSKLDPSKFTTEIDNAYWPMKPGYHWVYRELEDGELQRVDVRSPTRRRCSTASRRASSTTG